MNFEYINNILFTASSPFTAAAKRILKTCKQEIQEIETCPECYVNAHHKPESWFIEACVSHFLFGLFWNQTFVIVGSNNNVFSGSRNDLTSLYGPN